MAITTLPDPPSRSNPSDFSTKADAFLGALPTFVTECNAVAAAMDLNDTISTSSTSLAIGTGSKSLTVETSKSFQVGMSVKIAHDSTNWMHGEVTSYDTGTGALVVNVTTVKGSGTETSWTVTLSGPIALEKCHRLGSGIEFIGWFGCRNSGCQQSVSSGCKQEC